MTPPQARALLPDAVLAAASRGPRWQRWVEALPALLADLLGEWELAVAGPAMHGHVAVVVPVTAARHDVPAVLKVGLVDDETEHESLALQRWGGRGAVRLLQADPRRGALLLERLPGPHLTEGWDVQDCEEVGRLYEQLHVPPPPQVRVLGEVVGAWLERLADLPRDAPVPRRLVEQALAAGRDLCAEVPGGPRLLHTDLHYDNVLGSAAGTWVAIDPKPAAGDPHHEPAPLLWNRWDEAVAGGGVRDAVRARFHAVVDAAGLDETRARDWVVVRVVLNAAWEVDDAAAQRRAPDADWLTRCVTIAKAVQD